MADDAGVPALQSIVLQPSAPAPGSFTAPCCDMAKPPSKTTAYAAVSAVPPAAAAAAVAAAMAPPSSASAGIPNPISLITDVTGITSCGCKLSSARCGCSLVHLKHPAAYQREQQLRQRRRGTAGRSIAGENATAAAAAAAADVSGAPGGAPAPSLEGLTSAGNGTGGDDSVLPVPHLQHSDGGGGSGDGSGGSLSMEQIIKLCKCDCPDCMCTPADTLLREVSSRFNQGSL